MQDIQKYPTVTSLQLHQADPSLDKEKKSIYGHPLYPLLSLLLEQCEQATASPESNNPDTFEADLQSYIQRNENNDKLILSENKELDSLMVKAIQVLRIHLIELRKVNELCKDFCSRYINCLKTKIHSDSMFDDSEESSQNGSERLSPSMPISGPGGGSNSAYNSPYSNTGARGSSFMDSNRQHIMGNNSGMECMEFLNSTESGSPLSVSHLTTDDNNNQTPGYNPQGLHHHHPHHHHHHHPHHFSNLLDPSKQKRGVLPKKATQIMKQWLFQHLVHPYPTEDEKRQIATQTNLTLLQVNNWFINARRRILQPMLDTSHSPVGLVSTGSNSSSNKDKSSRPTSPHKGEKGENDSINEEKSSISSIYTSSCANRKKKAATNRPSNNRFWPASLAAAVSILSPHTTAHASMSNCTPKLSTPHINSTSTSTINTTSSTTTINSLKSTPLSINTINSSDSNRKRHSTTQLESTEPYQPPKLFRIDSSKDKSSKFNSTSNNNRVVNNSNSSEESSPLDQYMPPELNLISSNTTSTNNSHPHFTELGQSALSLNIIGSNDVKSEPGNHLLNSSPTNSTNKLANDLPLLSQYSAATQPDPLLSYPLFGTGPTSYQHSTHPSSHQHPSPSFISPSLSLSALSAAAAASNNSATSTYNHITPSPHHLAAAAAAAYSRQHNPLSYHPHSYDSSSPNKRNNISSLFRTSNWPPPPPPAIDPSYYTSSSANTTPSALDPHPLFDPSSHTAYSHQQHPSHFNLDPNPTTPYSYDHHSFSNFAMKALKSTNHSDNL